MEDELFNDPIDYLTPTYDNHKNNKNIEIEFRIGKLINNRFNTDISKEHFDLINNYLSECEEWDTIDFINSEDYFKDDKRLSVSDEETKCIKKEKLDTFDFNFIGSCYDIRVCFSSETPAKKFNITKNLLKRTKQRISYVIDGVSYDLTTVESNGTKTYSVEIEIKDIKHASTRYMLHNCFLKIKDIIEFCGALDPDAHLKLV